MANLRLSLRLSCLKQPLPKALHMAAALGVSGVEIDGRSELRPGELGETGVRQLRKMLDDLNLRVSSVRFMTRRGYDVIDDLDRRVDATKAVMKLAYQLGSSVVVNSIGRIPTASQGTFPSHQVQALEDLGKFGAYVGAILLAETGNGTGADLMNLLERCLSGYVGVALNPVNWILEGLELPPNIAAVAPRVQLVEARDAVRMTGNPSLPGGELVPLGQGLAEFPEILGLLEEYQYQGWYVLDGSSTPNPYAEAKRVIQYLKNL